MLTASLKWTQLFKNGLSSNSQKILTLFWTLILTLGAMALQRLITVCWLDRLFEAEEGLPTSAEAFIECELFNAALAQGNEKDKGHLTKKSTLNTYLYIELSKHYFCHIKPSWHSMLATTLKLFSAKWFFIVGGVTPWTSLERLPSIGRQLSHVPEI